jgi:hypothetical protein
MHRRLPPRGKSCREHLEDEDDSKGMDALSPALQIVPLLSAPLEESG